MEGIIKDKEKSKISKLLERYNLESKLSIKNKEKYEKKLFVLLFLSPNIILYLLFFAIPVVLVLILSMTNYDGWRRFDYVAFDNYRRLLSDKNFYESLGRTAVYASFSMFFKAAIPLGLAILMIAKDFKNATLPRILVYWPTLLSTIVVGVTWKWIFGQEGGILNHLLTSIGLEGLPWATNPLYATVAVIIASNWATAGFFMLIFIGTLKNIPEFLYEAASIEGASPWEKFRYITLPTLKPTIFMVSLMNFVNLFKEFAMVKSLTGGGPGNSTKYIVQYIYESGFERQMVGYASAASVVLMIFLMGVTLFQYKMQKGGEV